MSQILSDQQANFTNVYNNQFPVPVDQQANPANVYNNNPFPVPVDQRANFANVYNNQFPVPVDQQANPANVYNNNLSSMPANQQAIAANVYNNPFPMQQQQVPLNNVNGHACNNPARTAAAAVSPFTTIGLSVFRLDGNANFESFALKGDWKSAKKFLDNINEEERNSLLTSKISVQSRTALHVAACAGQWEFVEKLVGRMSKDALGMEDDLGCTALHYSAVGGGVKACKALVRKNPDLTQTISKDGWTPLLAAARFAPKDKEAVWFLAHNTTDGPPGCAFTGALAGKLAYSLALGGFHDILLYLIKSYPGLATSKDTCGCNLLDALALRPSDFKSGSNLGSWQKWIYPLIPVEHNLQYTPPQSAKLGVPTSPPTTLDKGAKWVIKMLWNTFCEQLQGIPLVSGVKQVQVEKLKHKYALELVNRVGRELSPLSDYQIYEFFLISGTACTMVTAAAYGVVEIVELCLQIIPNVIWLQTNQQPLLHIAVEHRQEKIMNLIYKMDIHNRLISPNAIDACNNTILHLAAKLAPPAHLRVVSGAALQMQRELQWYKEIEKLVHPVTKETPNADNKTAKDVFMEEHKDLLDKGEQWMKDTANSCMVVAALIATIMFAAAFTVPGGNNGDNGIPIFVNDRSFLIFAVSDALGLIFSTTSLLTFLSILTARYAVEDFLEHLPGLLITGLGSLFLAILAMMIAFAVSFWIIVREGSKPVSIAVIVLASLPAAVYAVLQLPLYIQMRKSMRNIFQH